MAFDNGILALSPSLVNLFINCCFINRRQLIQAKRVAHENVSADFSIYITKTSFLDIFQKSDTVVIMKVSLKIHRSLIKTPT
jgi:hypothetical protein